MPGSGCSATITCRTRQFEYALGTTAIVNGVQSPLTPVGRQRSDCSSAAGHAARARARESLPHLVALARRWIAESGLPKGDRRRPGPLPGAEAGRFGPISVQSGRPGPRSQSRPDRGLSHQTSAGHCEYFATALTLMLRSQGIPARLVVGYKCDQRLEQRGRILPGPPVARPHLGRGLSAARSNSRRVEARRGYWAWSETGGWLRLDPTPAAAQDMTADWFTPLRQGLDWLDFAWSNYVVELDCTAAARRHLPADRRLLQKAWQEATDPQRWRARFNPGRVALHLDRLRGEARAGCWPR